MRDQSGNRALLRFLVRVGVLPNDIADQAESQLAGDTDESAIDWLVRKGITSEHAVAEALTKGLQRGFVDLAAVALDPTVTALIREEVAQHHQVIPLRTRDRTLVVAMANPLDREALRAVEFATGRKVQILVATQTAVRDALEHAYHLDAALDAYLKGVPEDSDLRVAETDEDASVGVRNLMLETNLAPVVKLFNSIVYDGLRAHASDIHIEAASTGVRVRYRIDGLLEESSLRLPKWVQDPLIARCKVLAKLDITEHRVPQDGRFQIRHRDTLIDLRVSSLPTQFGEKVTVRVLDRTAAPTNLDEFDFSSRDLKCIRQAIGRPEGMILVTGPTGSGKTTTLYGMIAEIMSPTRNIITIENPIEYQTNGINQVEINEKQGLTFAGTLRSIMRQDPDVILVGEVRDTETAEIAVRAAQTGHLVLSTLHTNDAVATITRMVDLGIPPYMLASSLHLIIAQRLVRRVCPQCAEPYEPDAEVLSRLQIEGRDHVFRRGRGCSACRNLGFAGRVGVFEVVPITPQISKLIEAKAPESALRAQARADGAMLIAQHAAKRVCAGLVTPEEVLRVVDVSVEGARCPACDRAVEDGFAVCPHCTTVLQRHCTTCGIRLQPEWQVCPYCGRSSRPAGAGLSPSVRHDPSPGEGPPRQYRALVVDDDADIRELVRFMLEHSALPIRVQVAPSGVDALQQAQDEPPDLVLLDVMMPGMDGFAVCEQLRANVRTAFVPILMVTARDDPGSRVRGFLAGTDDYIIKPFVRAELLARVRRLIERTYGTLHPMPPAPAVTEAPELLQ
jgi:type IV pilus assembly protein PilB